MKKPYTPPIQHTTPLSPTDNILIKVSAGGEATDLGGFSGNIGGGGNHDVPNTEGPSTREQNSYWDDSDY